MGGELWSPSIGALPVSGELCRFRVWAPRAHVVEVHLLGDETGRPDVYFPLRGEKHGYHSAVVGEAQPGRLYFYRLDHGKELPDPASRHQRDGVFGPSEVCGHPRPLGPAPVADAGWVSPPLEQLIIYELHVGAFSPAGTFEGVSGALEELASLGVNALELMPVGQFPGDRGWGYDGVFPYAVQNSYGGPQGLAALVDGCHRHGVSVILDVVYNHLGPEGNCLSEYGPYFGTECPTPWGPSVNFDGPGSDEVRRYCIENALYWLADYGIDGLRLDAVHAIIDRSAVPFVQQLALEVDDFAKRSGRRIHLCLENDNNELRYLLPAEKGGFGLSAQWNDDFHHSLHTLLTGEKRDYYQDFGEPNQLAGAYREGFVYGHRYSRFRDRHHGSSSATLPASSFIVFAQNHDQVGNRAFGERLSTLVGFEALKLAAGVVLLSPFVPLLFMGEEYGERSPFPFFTSYASVELAEATREGRLRGFQDLASAECIPDPQRPETFMEAKLDRSRPVGSREALLFGFYERLISLRRTMGLGCCLSEGAVNVAVSVDGKVLHTDLRSPGGDLVCAFHFGRRLARTPVSLGLGSWHKRLDSAETEWGGPGTLIPATHAVTLPDPVIIALQPRSFVVFQRISDSER